MTTCMGNSCSSCCRLWCLWWCLFVLSFFPRDVLDEILNFIESVSEGFPTYSCILCKTGSKSKKTSLRKFESELCIQSNDLALCKSKYSSKWIKDKYFWRKLQYNNLVPNKTLREYFPSLKPYTIETGSTSFLAFLGLHRSQMKNSIYFIYSIYQG